MTLEPLKVSSAQLGKIFKKTPSVISQYVRYHKFPHEPSTYEYVYKGAKATTTLPCIVMDAAVAVQVVEKMYPWDSHKIPAEWRTASVPQPEKKSPQLPALPTDAAQRMTSREIAQLTGKRHDNVMQDIRAMMKGLQKDALSFQAVYLDAKGESRPEFQLPFDETMCLVSGYDVQMRMAIIRRWKELESKALPHPDFSDEVVAARAWADERARARDAERLALEHKAALEVAAPKALAFDKIAKTDGLLTPTEVAKMYNVHPNRKLFDLLRAEKWIYRRAKGSPNIAFEDKLKSGLLAHKIHTYPDIHGVLQTSTQVLFTPKGVTEVEKLLRGA